MQKTDNVTLKETLDEDHTAVDFEDAEINRSLTKSSPFFAPIKDVITKAQEEAGKDDDTEGAVQPNPHYCPTLVDIILKYSGTVPLWTGVMLKHLGKTRDSNAVVENWFRTTKSHSLFKIAPESRRLPPASARVCGWKT